MSEYTRPKLKEIIDVLEQFAPSYLAESWDHVGLMVGNKEQEVHKVLCALDLNEAVLEEAINEGANVIVTHHPFLFKPIKCLDLGTPQGRMIDQLIEKKISVYAMHTNYDITWGGLNDELAKGLGLEEIKLLDTTYEEPYYKCVIYVPVTHYSVVREAIVKHMNSQIGNYSGCTFTSGIGEGTFLPLDGSKPYLGQQGTLEKVEECQISFMGTNAEIQYILQAVKKVHPYEEIAVDVFELKNVKKQYGIGRYGKLKEPVTMQQCLKMVKQFFKVPYVRVTQTNEEIMIQKVAICSGAGSDYLESAAVVADVYITGDMKFHEGQRAIRLGIPVIDVGHYASEAIALKPIGQCIKRHFNQCEVLYSKVNGETLWIK